MQSFQPQLAAPTDSALTRHIDKHAQQDALHRRTVLLTSVEILCVFLLSFGALYWLTALPLSGRLFFAYTISGLYKLGSGTFAIYVAQNKTKGHTWYKVQSIFAMAALPTDSFRLLRLRIQSVFASAAQLLAWPARFLAKIILQRKSVDLGNPLALGSYFQLQNDDYLVASIVSAAIFVFSMTAGHSIWHDYYVKLWAMIVLAHVTFRHLSYLLSLRPLQQGLRQSLGNPYIRLIVIAAADLISLSVVYGYLTLKYRFASTSQLLDVVRTLVSVQEIFDVIGDKDANIVMVLSKLSELLLFLTILGVLRQIKMFERNDEDYGV